MKPIDKVLPFSKELELNVAENQEEYQTLPVFRTNYTSISRWKLTEEERSYLSNGGDLFIAQLNGYGQLYPILPLAQNEDTILEDVILCEKSLGLE